MIIMGDIHGNFGKLNKFINKHDPDTLLVCGDFGFWPKFKSDIIKNLDTRIYFCDGNHEDHDTLSRLAITYGHKEGIEVYPDIYYQPRGSVLNIEGKKVLFMGGGESTDKQYRVERYDWFPEEKITLTDIERVPDNIDIDIVVSHVCPTFVFDDMYKNKKQYDDRNCQSFAMLETLFDKVRPKEWYFGHFHQYYQQVKNDCKFTCMPELAWTSIK